MIIMKGAKTIRPIIENEMSNILLINMGSDQTVLDKYFVSNKEIKIYQCKSILRESVSIKLNPSQVKEKLVVVPIGTIRSIPQGFTCAMKLIKSLFSIP